jgi:hypothetical protein
MVVHVGRFFIFLFFYFMFFHGGDFLVVGLISVLWWNLVECLKCSTSVEKKKLLLACENRTKTERLSEMRTIMVAGVLELNGVHQPIKIKFIHNSSVFDSTILPPNHIECRKINEAHTNK